MVRRRNLRRRYRRRRKRDTVKKVRRTLNKMKKAIETKTFLTYINEIPNTISTIANLQVNPNTNQSVSAHGMIGLEYLSVGIKYNLLLTKQTSAQVGAMRIVMIWVKGDIPATSFSNFFDNSDDSTSPVTFSDYFAPLRKAEADNVKILMDRCYDFGIKNSTVPYAAGPQTKTIRGYIPINKTTKFFSTAQTIPDKGTLLFYAINRFASEVAVQGAMRFYYRDA